MSGTWGGIGRIRVVIGVAGSVLAGFGVFRLVSEVPLRDLVVLGVWLGAAVVVHDAVLSPAILGLGVLVGKVPARARTFVQGGLVAGGLVTAIAIPLILRAGSQPRAKALLEQDVGGNLAVLLGVITAVAVTAYLLRLMRGRHPAPGSAAHRGDDAHERRRTGDGMAEDSEKGDKPGALDKTP